MREEDRSPRTTRIRLRPKPKSDRGNEATPDRRAAELYRAEVDRAEKRDPNNESCYEPAHQRIVPRIGEAVKATLAWASVRELPLSVPVVSRHGLLLHQVWATSRLTLSLQASWIFLNVSA